MAATPESKVKKKVTKVLDDLGAYWFYPVASGFGKSGVPDIIACWRGRFVAIECKANGGKVTALQARELSRIGAADGIAVIVDENNVGELMTVLWGFFDN